jgi:Secretion system C-terminal sorting domain
MDILNTYTGSVTIQVKGGKGGDENDGGNSGRCYGGGGGGSGGTIYFTGALPGITTNVTGGIAGLEIGPDPACNTLVLPNAGGTGFTIPNYTWSRSTSPAGYCSLLLPVKLVSFTASVINRNVVLHWEIQNPEQVSHFIIERSTNQNQWFGLKSVTGNDQKYTYSATDENPLSGTVFYRIRIVEKNNSISYSPVRVVSINNGSLFSIYPNPASDKINIKTNSAPYELRLMDSRGRLVLLQKIVQNDCVIDIRSFPKGIYFIKVNEVVQKLIIH